MSAARPATRAEVQELARLQRADERRARGTFLVEGARLLSDALDARCDVVRIATDGRLDEAEAALVARAERAGVAVLGLTPAQAARVAAREHGPGLFAEARRPAPWSGDVPAAGAVLVAVACGLQDPGNLGAIARSACAFGARGAWLVGDGADPFGPKVVRAAAGAVFRLPVAAATLDAVAGWARARDVTLVAAVAPRARVATRASDEPGDTVAGAPRGTRAGLPALPARCALLLGHETRGVPARPGVATVTIAQRADVESLNVAAAAAVLAAAWFAAWGEV